MIKYIKINNLVYQNIEPKTVDEKGNTIWNILDNPTDLKVAIEDTLGWLTSRRIYKTIEESRNNAAISKAICLLAKILNSLTPDTSSLTQNEQTAFQDMINLANNGYTDSELLPASLQAIETHLQWYNTEMAKVQNLTTMDEMVNYLENLQPGI